MDSLDEAEADACRAIRYGRLTTHRTSCLQVTRGLSFRFSHSSRTVSIDQRRIPSSTPFADAQRRCDTFYFDLRLVAVAMPVIRRFESRVSD